MNGIDRQHSFSSPTLLSGTSRSNSVLRKRLPKSEPRNTYVFPYELDQPKPGAMADSYTTTKLKHLYEHEPNLQIDEIYINEAYYYKAKPHPEHEIIVFSVVDTINDMHNYVALDRNVLIPGSIAIVRLVSASNRANGPEAEDCFHVSHHGNVGSLIEYLGYTDKDSCECVETIRFQRQALTFAQLVMLASTVADSRPLYDLYHTNCYWFAGLVWDFIYRNFEIRRYEKSSNERGQFKGKRMPGLLDNREEVIEACKESLKRFENERILKNSQNGFPSNESKGLPLSLSSASPLGESKFTEKSEEASAGRITRRPHHGPVPKGGDVFPDRAREVRFTTPVRVDAANQSKIRASFKMHDIRAPLPKDISGPALPRVHDLTASSLQHQHEDRARGSSVNKSKINRPARRASYSNALPSGAAFHASPLGSPVHNLVTTSAQRTFTSGRNLAITRPGSVVSVSDKISTMHSPSRANRSPTPASGPALGSAKQPRIPPPSCSRMVLAVEQTFPDPLPEITQPAEKTTGVHHPRVVVAAPHLTSRVDGSQPGPHRITRTPRSRSDLPVDASNTTPEISSPKGMALRAQARSEGEKMQRSLVASRQAQAEGNEMWAKQLRDYARDHEEKMLQLHEEAAARIFEDMNMGRPENEIDLDGLYTSEVIPRLNQYLRTSKRQSELRIIIGKSGQGGEDSQLLIATIQQSIDRKGYPDYCRLQNGVPRALRTLRLRKKKLFERYF